MSQQINLIDPAFRQKKDHFSATLLVVVVGIALLALTTGYGYLRLRLGQMEAQAAGQASRLNALRGQLAQASAALDPRRRSPLLEGEIHRAEAELKARQDVLARLQGGELGDTRGFSAYLKAFAAEAVKGLWLTGLAISGGSGQMSLSGRALRPDLVPAYINRLGREPVMRGKTFSSLEMGLPSAAPTADKAAVPTVAPYLEFRIASTDKEPAK